MNNEEGNFLQSPEWGKTAEKVGHRVILKEIVSGVTVLMIIKDAKRGRYLEIPGGPLLDWKNRALVESVFAEIKQIAKAEHCVFIRFRPQLQNTPENLQLVAQTGAKPAPFHLHAQNTVILDLRKPESELLSDMRRQTRYEVRRAEKLKLGVKSGNSKALFEEFHKVQLETADGKKILEGKPEGDYLPAGTKLNYGLFLDYGGEVEYFEAASTKYGHLAPGAYAMLWQAIKDYQSKKLSRFNLWGIAPPNQPNHRYAKVTTFKTGFGGKQIEYIPAQDIVINPLRYRITKIIEELRKKIRHLS